MKCSRGSTALSFDMAIGAGDSEDLRAKVLAAVDRGQGVYPDRMRRSAPQARGIPDGMVADSADTRRTRCAWASLAAASKPESIITRSPQSDFATNTRAREGEAGTHPENRGPEVFREQYARARGRYAPRAH